VASLETVGYREGEVADGDVVMEQRREKAQERVKLMHVWRGRIQKG